jgi:hypothetical protein
MITALEVVGLERLFMWVETLGPLLAGCSMAWSLLTLRVSAKTGDGPRNRRG